MASTRRPATARRNHRNVYVAGSAARRLQEIPSYRPERTWEPEIVKKQHTAQKPAAPRQLSAQAQRNREKARNIGVGYVLFLAAVSGMIMFFCIHYLQVQNEITNRKKVVTSLESQVNELKEENDALYSQVTSGINLREIKKIAIGRLGMKVPEESQIVPYETVGRSYVRQFQDVSDVGR